MALKKASEQAEFMAQATQEHFISAVEHASSFLFLPGSKISVEYANIIDGTLLVSIILLLFACIFAIRKCWKKKGRWQRVDNGRLISTF